MENESRQIGSQKPKHQDAGSESADSERCDREAALLRVERLSIGFRMYDEASKSFFRAPHREQRVIDDLSMSVDRGEIVAIVGASGSGKTLLANAVMGSFEPNAIVSGGIWFEGRRMDADALADARGTEIALVPQSVAFLDPLMRVGRQVEGVFASENAQARRERRKELFARYRLDERAADLYPFELSGGMARRVLLCCALIDSPHLIIADEPTPGLDLPLALKALEDFRAFADTGGGVLLITHDIELALQAADRIAVFKDGTVVEEVPVSCFDDPALLSHPFSRALWHALPSHDFAVPGEPGAARSVPAATGDTKGRR